MLSDMMRAFSEEFVVMERSQQADGEGGSVTVWTGGTSFTACMSHDTTVVAQQAEGAGTASTYTLLIPSSMALDYPDVVKRVSDGFTMQITSASGDLRTPSTSPLSLRAVKARKWEVPA